MTVQHGDHTCKHIFTVITSDVQHAKSSQQQITANELRYNRVNRSIVNIIGKVADNENNPQWQSNISELQAVSDSK